VIQSLIIYRAHRKRRKIEETCLHILKTTRHINRICARLAISFKNDRRAKCFFRVTRECPTCSTIRVINGSSETTFFGPVCRSSLRGSGRVLSREVDDDRDFYRLDNLLEDIETPLCTRRNRKYDYKERDFRLVVTSGFE